MHRSTRCNYEEQIIDTWSGDLIIRFVGEKNRFSIRDLATWSRSICWSYRHTRQEICLSCSLTASIFWRLVCVIKSSSLWFSITRKSFFESNAWRKKLRSACSRIENYEKRSKTNFMISQNLIFVSARLKSENFVSCYENAKFEYKQKTCQQSRHFWIHWKKKNQFSDRRRKYNDAINEKNLSRTSYRSMWKKWKWSDSCSHRNNGRNDNVNRLSDSNNSFFFQSQNRLCFNQSTVRLPLSLVAGNQTIVSAFDDIGIRCNPDNFINRQSPACIWSFHGRVQQFWHHIQLPVHLMASASGAAFLASTACLLIAR